MYVFPLTICNFALAEIYIYFLSLSLYFIRTTKLLMAAHLYTVGEDNVCFADVALGARAVPQSNGTCSENHQHSINVVERRSIYIYQH